MSTEHFAEIIREAATSPLGILALIILLLGSLAVIFFGKSSEKARMTVWVMAFGGALVFGFAILRAEQRQPTSDPETAGSQGEGLGEQDASAPAAAVDTLSANRSDEPASTPRAAIQLVYDGDPYGCTLPITISVGDRSITPQGSLVRLDDVPLGTQPYRITGAISCPYLGGACAVDSTGTIEAAAGRTYHVVWQAFPNRGCVAELQTRQ